MFDSGAEFGSSEAGSLGGKARAESLSKKERADIARRAAETRWGRSKFDGTIERASHTGDIVLAGGTLVIPCAVLSDGTRVLTQSGFLRAIGRPVRPKKGFLSEVPPFLDIANIKPFVDKELRSSSKPIAFQIPTGAIAWGYKAELLPRVCDVYLQARDAGALTGRQQRMAQGADALMRALAQVGIVALVDEATGYQADRARDALARILETFIAKELRPWVRTFQWDFYKELLRLRGLEFDGTLKQPRYIGKLTNDLVYNRLAPGVLDELKRINPANEKGQRRHKHFQWLSQQLGYQKLVQHLASVTTLMKVFDDYESFKKAIDKALPPQNVLPLFDRPHDSINKADPSASPKP